MGQLGYAPLLEASLPNGRRADVMALGPRGELVIVEVKSSLEDFRADQKWREYQPYCDAFYFAVAPEFPPRGAAGKGPGLIVADGFGGAVLTEAPVAPLAACAAQSPDPGLRSPGGLARASPGSSEALKAKRRNRS